MSPQQPWTAFHWQSVKRNTRGNICFTKRAEMYLNSGSHRRLPHLNSTNGSVARSEQNNALSVTCAAFRTKLWPLRLHTIYSSIMQRLHFQAIVKPREKDRIVELLAWTVNLQRLRTGSFLLCWTFWTARKWICLCCNLVTDFYKSDFRNLVKLRHKMH